MTRYEAIVARCTLCSGTAIETIRRPNRAFCHCPECDLILVPERFHLSAASQRERYARHNNHPENPGYVGMLNEVADLLDATISRPARVLDYGSGPSPVLVDLLRRRGVDAIGFDPLFAPELDATARFDAVVAVETLEHVAHPAEELRRICDLVRPGGTFVMRTLLHQGPLSVSGWWYARDSTHVSFYSAATLRSIERLFPLNLVQTDGLRYAVFRRRSG